MSRPPPSSSTSRSSRPTPAGPRTAHGPPRAPRSRSTSETDSPADHHLHQPATTASHTEERTVSVEHDAAAAIVGIENPAGFGRPLTTALAGAGFEVLNVPAWRTHRDRRRLGPGKTDPGDAHAIAQVVLRCRDELGPALEPELVRALGLLELQRHRLGREPTMAIQRLRSTWLQVDPVAEAQTLLCERQRELRKLKRIRFGDGLADTIAAGIVRDLARDIDALNQR